MIQAGLSGSVGGHAFSFAALGCQVVVVLSPAPGRAALLSHAVCPAASSAPRGTFAYSVYPLRGLETVSRAARCRSLRAAIAHGQLLRNSAVTADPLTLYRFVCGMGELSGKTNKTVKRLFQVKLTFFATPVNDA